MGLFDKIFGKKEAVLPWDDIKNTDKVYPESSITLFTLQTKNGPGTGWVDMGYKKYPYKKNCRYNFLIKVDLTNEIAEKNPDLDMGTIEDFLTDELRKICVAHIVGRLVTDKGLNIEMYLEKLEEPQRHLEFLSKKSDKLFSFEIDSTEDPWWLAIRGLMKLS